MSALPDEAYIAALTELPAVGPVRLRALLDIGDPPAVWAALCSGSARVREPAGRPDRLDLWRTTAVAIDVAQRWRELRSSGIGVLWRGGAGYPEPLVGDPEPPEVLFTQGDPSSLARQRVAVVGMRQCTRYGRDLAYELGFTLAAAGVTVVSGLARGIDAAAHQGALDAAGAAPAAVVGSAIDNPYPRENRHLWNAVADAGVVCGEAPPGAPTERWRFPARNRIIAGLAQVTVVVESAARGGSLYTAAQAVERGRVVLAVPGPIRSPASLGTNRLLADGIHPLCEVGDVLEVLGMVAPARAVGSEPSLDDGDRRVLDAIGWQPATLDDIVRADVGDLTAVGAALERLAEAGEVAQRGAWYERVHRFRSPSGSNDP